MLKLESLAWYIFPKPDGKSYSKNDLANINTVVELFDYCQINLATITGKGWEFLINNYGIEKLLIIDEESGWLNDGNIHESIDKLVYESRISGYDPITKKIGIYNEVNGEFTASNT